MATTSKPRGAKQPTAKQDENLAEVANPPAHAHGSLRTPTVEPDDDHAGFAVVTFFDEKGGEKARVQVPEDHLRNLAKEATRVCSLLGV